MSTKMSKLSFRAKPLDASKPMPVYINEELRGLPDYSATNRAVPQMPSGMHKEEECEHHLQRAICTGLIIPTPEFTDVSDVVAYDRLYPPNFKTPRQLIHMQSFAMDQDIPDYDMDSEDELWFSSQKNKLEITPLKFEEMMDRLEKGSGQTVLSEQQAKALLKDDDDLILAVYDYWLNKRLKTQHPLIPAVRTEHHPGTAPNNPYIAFRRRTEKMQTRKHRKNDETSYEKMLKLKRDLSRAVTLLEMIKRREKTKREVLHLTVEVFEKRYQAGDFSGQLLAEVSAVKPCPRPAFAPLFPNQFSVNHQNWPAKDEPLPRKEKRQYKKRKHKVSLAVSGGVSGSAVMGGRTSVSAAAAAAAGLTSAGVGGESLDMDGLSSDEGEVSPGLLTGATVSDDDDSGADGPEGPFVFRRRKNCSYHAPLAQGQGNWPWCSREEGGLADRRYRYCLTSLATPHPGRCVGFARRRVGRGGRVILDRAHTPMDDVFRSLDFTIFDSKDKSQQQNAQHRSALKQVRQTTQKYNQNVRPHLKRSQSTQPQLGDIRFTNPLASQAHRSTIHSILAEHQVYDTKHDHPLFKQRRLEQSYPEVLHSGENPKTKSDLPTRVHNAKEIVNELSAHARLPHQHNKDQDRVHPPWYQNIEGEKQNQKALNQTKGYHISGEWKSQDQDRPGQEGRIPFSWHQVSEIPSQTKWHHNINERKSQDSERTGQETRAQWRHLGEEQHSVEQTRIQNQQSNIEVYQQAEEQKPLVEELLWEDQENDDDLFLSEIRNDWLHFRPVPAHSSSGSGTMLGASSSLGTDLAHPWEAQSVMDLNTVRLEVEVPNGGSPTELSVFDVLCNMPGSVLDANYFGVGSTSDLDASSRWGTDTQELVREDVATQTLKQTTPHQTLFDHSSSLNPQQLLPKQHEPSPSDDDDVIYVGCSQFNVHPGPSALKTSPPQMWASTSSTSHPAPGPGRPLTSAARTAHQHRKRERHHQPNQSYSVYSAGGSTSSSSPQPLSNGVSIIPVSVSAVLSANPGLLRQGLSNGPPGSTSSGVIGTSGARRRIPVFIKQELMEEQVDGSNEPFYCGSATPGAVGSPSARRRTIPVFIKQEVIEEPVDGPSEPFNCMSFSSAAGPSLAEVSAPGVRVLPAGGDASSAATAAAAACGEQQKLKTSATSQQQVLMEVT